MYDITFVRAIQSKEAMEPSLWFSVSFPSERGLRKDIIRERAL
jgi:hypothetical protein